MTETIIAAGAGILGTIVGGLITYFTQKAQFKNEMLRVREENKNRVPSRTNGITFFKS